ncbi:retrovirus-related pol polyprotein from transposon TNT 1-94 [Tanacetum coccineum]
MQMVGGNKGNQFRQYAGQNVGNQVVQNPGVQNVRNQNGVIVVPGIANQNGNGNVVAARAEGNANGNIGNQIRCYNCRGLGHLTRNYTVRPRRRDAAYLQTQLLIAQKEEAGIQLQAKEFDLMAAVADLDEIEEANANCILMVNLHVTMFNHGNHDLCMLIIEWKNSRGKETKGSKERLASPKPSKPRMRLRWSPTGKMFDIKGKLITSSESNGDNACTPNPQEPTIKRFPNSTFSLGKLSKYVCGASTQFLGIVRFRNDHVAAILGYGDLQWGNILITKVYFVESLGHNLFSVGQFCDSDLELWHRRLSHLNFDTMNDLARNNLVTGLPKFKYHKEHLCPSCEQGKRKRASHPPKPIPNSKSKDEAPEEIKNFLKRITVLLQAPVIIVRTDNGTEFKNQVLQEYFKSVGITHQASSVPIATACYTQNRSIIHRRFDKTPYELINGRKPDISFLYVFGALCYPKNDREDIRKLGAKGDIGFFIGYSANSCAYRVYNQRTKKIMETMNVTFDELLAMVFEQSSLKPELQSLTSGQISSGLDLPYAPSTITTQRPTEGELDLLFKSMYDDHIGGQPSAAPRTIPAAQAP